MVVVPGAASLLVCGARDQQRHRDHQRDRGHDGGHADHPRPARRTTLVVPGWLVVVVVVVEPEIGRHIWGAGEVLGLRSRIGPRICVGFAGVLVRLYFGNFAYFAAAPSGDPGVGTGPLPESAPSRPGPGGFGPLMFACPVQLHLQRARPRSYLVAHTLGSFSFVPGQTLPNRPGQRCIRDLATDQLMPRL